MSLGGENCLRLCRLVDHRLRPFTRDGVILENKEKEKQLLIALSNVFTEVQRWIREIDGDSDSEAIQVLVSHENSSDECDHFLQSHHCMTKIISELVLLLGFENQYVKHLVGNVLTEISKFVLRTGSNWQELVHSLCFCMELLLARSISSSPPSIIGSENLECYLSTLSNILLPKLKNGNFSTVSCILRVLRNNLKFLKHEQSDLVGVFFDSVNSCLSKFPWNLLGEIFTEKNCNFVEVQSDDDSSFCNLHHSQVDHFDRCLSRYFSHKLLILMIRLGFHCHLQCSTLLLWLQLCRNHFQKLLFLSALEPKSASNASLEDSPLILSYFGEERSPCSSHLQRLAIFLFLRCSLSFICKQPTEMYDASLGLKSQLICTTNLESKCDDCSCSKKGVQELYNWLQENLPTNIFLDTKMYAKNCVKFASSFLQLYMHEDDLLFKVLLQLLPLPSRTQPWSCEGSSQEVKEVLLHVSNIFDPLNMFHLFLKELNYDHEMILDYLISKNAGTFCLEYLLRCLHIINYSKYAPVDSANEWEDITTHSSCKRRKVFLNNSNTSEELLSRSLNQRNETLQSFEDTKNYEDFDYKPHRFGVKAFKKAKHCLHSLKRSLENLHRENLFPYNPEVLIKRLTKFLELPWNN